jgi:hypothetical protein
MDLLEIQAHKEFKVLLVLEGHKDRRDHQERPVHKEHKAQQDLKARKDPRDHKALDPSELQV